MASTTVSLGVDPASAKAAFVAIGEDGEFLVKTFTRFGKSGGPACASAWHATQYVHTLTVTHFGGADVHAFIESPVVGRGGVRSTMVQCFTSGAIQGALHDAGCRTQTANVSTWKKYVVGKGNATKEEVAKHLRLRWPALHAAAGGNQDVYDAACIAIYGGQLLGWELV